MNKVVLISLTISAVIFISGCSSSGSHRSNQSGSYAYGTCSNCASGSSAVQHGHRNQRASDSGSSFAKVAGALLVGGLIFSAIDDDDDNDSSHTK